MFIENLKMIHAYDFFCTSRNFCYFKVRGSHACHGIYFIFHGNTRVSRVESFSIAKNVVLSILAAFRAIRTTHKLSVKCSFLRINTE